MKDDRKETINEKTKKLDELVKYFENEEIDLDEAIEKYEKAVKLVKDIEKVIKEYELRVSKIKAELGNDEF